MKIKVDIINLFNRAIEAIDNLLKDKVCPHCEETIETDYETVRDTSGIDTGFQIVTKYLQEIAERAVKIEDAVILECLLNLKCISGTEDDEKEIIEKAKNIKEEV